MKQRTCLATLACAILLAAVPAAADALPATPSAATRLLHVSQFEIAEPFPFTWHADRLPVERGTILVIEVAPELIRPRQTAEPVLYVGDQPAWRAGGYNPAGIVVAFVPGQVDLGEAPVWFGSPELPERVTPEIATRELALARAAGIRPFDRRSVQRAAAAEVQDLRDRTQLLIGLEELARRFIPQTAAPDSDRR